MRERIDDELVARWMRAWAQLGEWEREWATQLMREVFEMRSSIQESAQSPRVADD